MNGVIEREWRPENDYQIDRESQQSRLFTGIENFVSQDLMATESMGPIYDRSQEHLGNTDKAIIRMRRLLLQSARDLAERHRAAGHDTDTRAGAHLLGREDPGPGRRLAHPRHSCRPHSARDGEVPAGRQPRRRVSG